MPKHAMHYLFGLGSNLGDRAAHIQNAVDAMVAHADMALYKPQISSLYTSPALLPDGAPKEWNMPYLNAVFSAHSPLPPEEMLMHTQSIEKSVGKVKQGHWAPRIIDIDILAADEKLIETYSLTLPHRHIAERNFVLIPLSEILPDWEHPFLQQTAEQMLEALGDDARHLTKHPQTITI
jgi:2-amino-4-hydroxy-6-hydroxymethyldihydropteridine diphosphokinase/dihydropteroate synthase